MTKNKTKTKEKPIVHHRFSHMIHTPFSIEIKPVSAGNFVVTVGGVTSILLYETEKMTFAYQGGALSVLGSKLVCRSYQNGYIEVRGKVENIELR